MKRFLLSIVLLAPGMAQASEFEIPRGWYLESDLGAFMRFGGVKHCPLDCSTQVAASVGNSALQPFVGLAVGKDLTDNVGVQLLFGTGYVAGAAVGDEQFYTMPGTDPSQKILPPQDYSLTFINPQVTYLILIEQLRLGLEVKAGGGLVIAQDAIDVSGKPVTTPTEAQGSSMHLNVSAGLSVKYLTLLTGFVVGADVSGGLVLGPTMASGAAHNIPYLSISPAIKYVF
ncbi:MAG: hypothetical protein CMH55_03535 [Myxococcales bacterium]|nr:hypothetical protein [Myxococcales bacterium]